MILLRRSSKPRKGKAMANWSKIWDMPVSRMVRAAAVQAARFTDPKIKKADKDADYPACQPFDDTLRLMKKR